MVPRSPMETDPLQGTVPETQRRLSLTSAVGHSHCEHVVVVILIVVVVIVVVVIVVIVIIVRVDSVQSVDGGYDYLCGDPNEGEKVENSLLGTSTLVTTQPW